METRKLKKEKQEIVPGPSFEQVTVKEEPDEAVNYVEEGTASTSRKRTKAARSTNTPKSTDRQSDQQTQASVRMKSRYTQVIPEDIDLTNMIRSNQLERLGGDKPIDPTGFDEIVPQCRLCLRRLSRDNLEIIERKHKKKAKAAYQIRIFPQDAYPFICTNCSSLMDIFIEFKNAVTQAKRLLVNERAYLESDGWDDPDFVDALKKCKQVVEFHRKQIDTMYEEHSKPQKNENEDDIGDNVENDASDEPDDDSNILLECVKTEDFAPSHSNADNSSENIEEDVKEAAQLCTVDSMDVDSSTEDEGSDPEDIDYKPEDEERNDEDYDPEANTSKTRKSDSHAGKPRTRVYKPVKTQLCDFCGKSVRPESVESHKNLHLGIRPYVCSVENCGLTYLSRYLLTRHNKRFHGKNGAMINTCNICGRQIRGSVSDLKHHQKTHNTDQKNYICPVCGKGFTMKWYLTQHSIIHSGEFPHKCQYCGKKFNNKWSMKTHEKNMHEKKNQVPKEENPTWDPESVPQVEQQPNP